jgi:Nif11 domain
MTTTIDTQTTRNSLEQFYQELLKSPELQAKLKEASDPESLCQAAVQLGAERGYCFTVEQVRAAMTIEASMGGDLIEETDLTAGVSPTKAGRCGVFCDGGKD